MRRLALAFVVAGLLVAAAAAPAAAKTTRIPVSTAAQAMTVLDPGTTTMHGSVMSVRGMVMREEGNWHNPVVDGPAINVVNYDLDLATGAGELWGRGEHRPTAVPDGAWECHFHAVFVNYSFTGKGVCHGIGSLRSWQWRVELTQTPQGTAAEGYIFQPGH
ncbi:MAG: hypothetical protein AB1627_01475 [Chloroflexota bacterium]